MRKAALAAAITLTLSACGGGGGSPTSNPTNTEHSSSTSTSTSVDESAQDSTSARTGVFKDSNVAGLTYSSGTLQGTTNGRGEFKYEAGATVTFSVGGVVLGTTTGDDVVTPLDLVPDSSPSTPQVQNMVRFLAMLDADGDAANGITISEEAQSIAAAWQPVDFAAGDFAREASPILAELISIEGDRHSLAEPAAATEHLEGTLNCLYSGVFAAIDPGDSPNDTPRHYGFMVSPSDGKVTVIGYSNNEFGDDLVAIDSDTPLQYGEDQSDANDCNETSNNGDSASCTSNSSNSSGSSGSSSDSDSCTDVSTNGHSSCTSSASSSSASDDTNQAVTEPAPVSTNTSSPPADPSDTNDATTSPNVNAPSSAPSDPVTPVNSADSNTTVTDQDTCQSSASNGSGSSCSSSSSSVSGNAGQANPGKKIQAAFSASGVAGEAVDLVDPALAVNADACQDTSQATSGGDTGSPARCFSESLVSSSNTAISGGFTSPNALIGTLANKDLSTSTPLSGDRIGGTSGAKFRFSVAYTGGDIGVIAIDIDENLAISGVLYSVRDDEQYTLSGSVDGSLFTVTTLDGTSIVGTLDFDEGTLSGTWVNTLETSQGTLSGTGCRLN